MSYNKSIEQLKKYMLADKLTENDILWQETLKGLEVRYLERIKELDVFFGVDN